MASKLTASEINSNISISGEIVAASGSITNLSVDHLTLAYPGSIIPFPGFIALPLSVAVLGGTTVTYSDVAAPLITFNTVTTDTATWTVFVPTAGAETRLKIYVPVKAALGSNTLSVSINATLYPVVAANLKNANTSYVYSTAAFDWKTSTNMSIVISSSIGSGISIGDAPYVGF